MYPPMPSVPLVVAAGTAVAARLNVRAQGPLASPAALAQAARAVRRSGTDGAPSGFPGRPPQLSTRVISDNPITP